MKGLNKHPALALLPLLLERWRFSGDRPACP
jgi:hypothetical protein